MSIKNLVQKTVSREVVKHVEIKPEDVADLLKKAVGAPADTALVQTTAADGVTPIYVLDWKETPKPRAPRKAKGEAKGEGKGDEGTQA